MTNKLGKQLKLPILFICAAFGLYAFYKYVYDGTEHLKSTINNKDYKVRTRPGKETRANLLALIDIKLNTIVDSLKTSQYSSYGNVQRLISNWNKGVTIKEIGNLENDAAYVINKQHMSFCLPDDTDKSLDNKNLMTYVGIHELAHIMSSETGHGSEFRDNFVFLLNYSKTLKYLNPETNNYEPLYIPLNEMNTKDNYCGVSIINSIN